MILFNVERIQLWPLACATVALATAGAPIRAQEQQARWFDGARPVSQAIDVLTAQCKCVITYEDPKYRADNVVDATERLSRSPAKTSRVYIPQGSPFLLAVASTAAVRDAHDLTPAVNALLAAYHGTGPDIRFRLDASDAVLHVVPAAGSVLNASVSMVENQASAEDMIAALLRTLSSSTNEQIAMGLAPMTHLKQSAVRISANGETGQSVLTRILAATGRKVSWRLFYDYTLKKYFLNLHFADPATCPAEPGRPCNPGDILNVIRK
jgi:hypothetical protein